ncbi:MAG: hypothetical protein PVI97_06195 [Candidatus Thiodiazotropha sp.]|jgi:hypothetical protein
MKRIASVIAIFLIVVILVSDIEMIAKYYQKPNAYALMENVSFLHFLFLVEWGVQFAYAKAALSLIMLFFWSYKLAYPAEVTTLRYTTLVYALTWAIIGLLVLTGIVGIHQYSAGLPIRLYDFLPLFVDMGIANLTKLIFVIVCLPLLLMIVPVLHNKLTENNKQAHVV